MKTAFSGDCVSQRISPLTIANLITLLRIVLVPAIVWAILSNFTILALLLFLLAGFSDAIDGLVARYFDQQTELGTILDPIADKLMLVSVFIALAYLGKIPLWLVILIVSRDMLIIFGVMLALTLSLPVKIRPLWISKANTLAQIVLAGWVLFVLAFDINFANTLLALELVTGCLTALSAAAYMWQGIVLFAAGENKVP